MELQFLAALHAVFFLSFPYFLWSLVKVESGADWAIRVGLLLFVSIAWLPGPTIAGLEYEDAYVHLAAAKYQIAHLGAPTDGFYVLGCAVGSINECVLTSTYGTHLIGFSSLLTLLMRLGLPWLGLASAVSYLATIASVQVAWTVIRRHAALFPSCIAMCLLLTSPAYLVVAGTGFAEPLFGLFFITWILLSTWLLERHVRHHYSVWVLYAAAGILLVATKKEGVLLVGLVLFQALWYARFSKNHARRESLSVAAVCLAVVAFSVVAMGIAEAEIRHSADIGHPAFDIAYMPRLLSAAFQDAGNVRNFGPLWWFFLLTLPLLAVLRAGNAARFAAVAFAYICLYCLHARTGAFANGAAIEPEAMTRYLFVLAPLAAMSIASAFSKISPLKKKWLSRSRYLLGVFVVVSSLCATLREVDKQRVDLAADEDASRRLPPQISGDPTRDAWLTSYPLAFGAEYSPDLKVVSASFATSSVGRSYLAGLTDANVRILKFPDH